MKVETTLTIFPNDAYSEINLNLPKMLVKSHQQGAGTKMVTLVFQNLEISVLGYELKRAIENALNI